MVDLFMLGRKEKNNNKAEEIIACVRTSNNYAQYEDEFAYMKMNLQPHNKAYLPTFKCICLISVIIAYVLLVAILISLLVVQN